MEHAYLKMAQAAGIHCASSQIIPTDGEIHPRHHLFVERFDVDRGTGRRHHLVTLAGMAHAFRLTYESLLELTLKITQDHGQVREAVRRMIFNVRAGNADDHGKNHSFLYDEDRRQWRLSPAYDITLSYERDRSLSGLFPATFGNQPRGVALQKQAVAAGLSEAEFAGIDEQVRSACNRWPEFADQAGVSAAEKARAAAAIAELGKSIDGVPLPTGMGPRARSSRRRLF
jgi:serine/threonine-protein kinase HipA